MSEPQAGEPVRPSDAPLLGRHDAVPRRRWRWLLPLLIGLAVIGLVASLVVRVRDKDRTTATFAVNAYLEAVETGAVSRAYGLLCAEFRQAVPRRTFETDVAAERASAGGVVGHHIARVEVRPHDQRLATYTVRRKYNDIVVDAALVREQGKWKLCGFKTRPRPEKRVPADEVPLPPGFTDTGTTTTTR